MLEWVVCIKHLKDFSFGLVEFSAKFMGTFPKSTVELQYFILIEVQPIARNVVPPMAFLEWMSKARVDRLSRENAPT